MKRGCTDCDGQDVRLRYVAEARAWFCRDCLEKWRKAVATLSVLERHGPAAPEMIAAIYTRKITQRSHS
jgi:hypothetical protein